MSDLGNSCWTIILKVDLTAYIEKHEFCFDAVLDENVANDEVILLQHKPFFLGVLHGYACFAFFLLFLKFFFFFPPLFYLFSG